MITRRSILFGLISAPVVVRMGLIMPVRSRSIEHWLIPPVVDYEVDLTDWQWGYADRMPRVIAWSEQQNPESWS